jgi:hypothetical protein
LSNTPAVVAFTNNTVGLGLLMLDAATAVGLGFVLALLPPPQAEAITAAIAISMITPANFVHFILSSLRSMLSFSNPLRFGTCFIIKLRPWQVEAVPTALRFSRR